jgi:hypothetical protein
MPNTALSASIKVALCLMLYQCYLLQFMPPIQYGGTL